MHMKSFIYRLSYCVFDISKEGVSHSHTHIHINTYTFTSTFTLKGDIRITHNLTYSNKFSSSEGGLALLIGFLSNLEQFCLYKLTLLVPCIFESCIEIEIKLIFYFHTLWCLKRFYESLYGLHKTFWGSTKECENKHLTKSFLVVWSSPSNFMSRTLLVERMSAWFELFIS